MLNLAKIEAGELKPNLQYFSVLEPIVDTLVTFEPRLEEKQIEITVDCQHGAEVEVKRYKR